MATIITDTSNLVAACLAGTSNQAMHGLRPPLAAGLVDLAAAVAVAVALRTHHLTAALDDDDYQSTCPRAHNSAVTICDTYTESLMEKFLRP